MRSCKRLLAGLLACTLTVGTLPAMAAGGKETDEVQRVQRVQRLCEVQKDSQTENRGRFQVTAYTEEETNRKITFEICEGDYAAVVSCDDVYGTLTVPCEIELKDGSVYPVTMIDSSAFSGCTHLKKVVLPDSIVEVGAEAFFECSRLQEVVLNDTSGKRLTITDAGQVWSTQSEQKEPTDESISVAEEDESGLVLHGAERSGNEYTLQMRLGETFSVADHLTKNGEPVDAASIEIRGSNGIVTVSKKVLTTWGTGKTDLTISVGKDTLTLHVIVTGNGTTTLGTYAFAMCTRLRSITLPATMTDIGMTPFLYCDNLTEVAVEDGNQTYFALEPDMLCKINGTAYQANLSAGMSEEEAKRAAADELVMIANGVEGDVVIPEGIKTLAVGAIFGCNMIETLSLPSTVETVNTENDPGNFALCDFMSVISVSEENPYYASQDGILYSKDGTTLVKIPEQYGETVVVPDGVATIASYAAAMNYRLQELVVSDTVTEIASNAFFDCEYLETLSLGSRVKTIGSRAFYQCEILRKVSIPESCTTIASYAFASSGLSKLSLPVKGSLKTLQTGVFSDTNLSKVVIPASVTRIKEYALGDNAALTAVYFMGDRPKIARSTVTSVYDDWQICEGGAFDNADKRSLKLYFRNSTDGWRNSKGEKRTVDGLPTRVWAVPTKPEATIVRTTGSRAVVTIPVNSKQTISGYQIFYSATKNGSYEKCAVVPKGKSSVAKMTMKHAAAGYYKVRTYCALGGTYLYSGFTKAVKLS